MTVDNMVDTSAEQRQVAESETPATFGDWIVQLNPGTVVRSGVHGNSLIWTGRYNNAATEAYLMSTTQGWFITVSREEPLNDWEIQTNSDVVDQGMLRMAQHYAETLRQAERNTESGRRMLDSVAAERETALEKLAQIDSDLKFLNEELNKYALGKGWCPEYESIMESWNAQMQVLKLEGREWDWIVPTEVTLTFNANLPIRVRGGQDEAHDAVQSLSATELMDLLVERGESPRIAQVEMTSEPWRQ